MTDRHSILVKEIDLIQSVINRMATTSFLIKGWAITVMGFIFALQSHTEIMFVAVIPIFLFWILDTYFLQQERLYRKLYTWVIENRMTDDSHIYSLNATRFEKSPYFKVMFSITLGPFYCGGIVLVLLAYLVAIVLK
jgi:hypothetical protein